jgi:hypothetical protein
LYHDGRLTMSRAIATEPPAGNTPGPDVELVVDQMQLSRSSAARQLAELRATRYPISRRSLLHRPAELAGTRRQPSE